ncbi:MAG: hypothetical protein JJV97_02550 [SAR324 cluster bacterium]|nr:hypothetical protein [SAR324 cluster bacterium]
MLATFKLTGISLIIVFLITNCAILNFKKARSAPKVDFKGLEIVDINKDGVTITIYLDITNTSKYNLPTYDLSFDIHVLDEVILKITDFKVQGSAPQEVAEVKVRTLIYSDELEKISQKNLKDFFNKHLEIDYKIIGSVNLYGIDYPFSLKSKFFVPTIKLINIDLIGISDDKFNIKAIFEINNENSIKMPIYNFELSLFAFDRPLLLISNKSIKHIAAHTKKRIPVSFNLKKSAWKNLFDKIIRNHGVLQYKMIYDSSFGLIGSTVAKKQIMVIPLDKLLLNRRLIDLL